MKTLFFFTFLLLIWDKKYVDCCLFNSNWLADYRMQTICKFYRTQMKSERHPITMICQLCQRQIVLTLPAELCTKQMPMDIIIQPNGFFLPIDVATGGSTVFFSNVNNSLSIELYFITP